ncbi:MAG: Asp23/Gls24 family envelope stress response protein [Pseudonocardiaceae bacterium]
MAVNEAHSRQDVARLACGRDAATVWDRTAAGHRDAHERNCLHCQAVSHDQRRLATAIAALADEVLEPPPSLLDRVMGAVLAELRPADYLPLPSRHGPTRIDRIAAAGVLRHAVDQMATLRVRSCQISMSDIDEGSEARLIVGSPTARVRITVTARFGTDLISAATRVRQMILTAAEDLLGLPLAAVDVDVVDVFEGPRRPAPTLPNRSGHTPSHSPPSAS